ncbi:MAG TPA: DUF4239 domain-containing protein [Clostridia bacterium]|nr:DUF4239 domain-containing protein [Clostridia bacterium]
MKSSIVFAGLLLLTTLSGGADELKGPPATEFANEAADLPFNPRHLGLYTVLFAVSLGLVLFVLVEIGQRIGKRHLGPDISEARKGLAAVDGFVFSLLGLLVAFTFHGAAERFDARRKLVIQEASFISTAWQRLDLLDEKDRLPLRELFRQYLDVRLGTYRKLPDAPSVNADLARSLKLKDEIWQRSVAACHKHSTAGTHLIPALNHMFDIAHTRVEIARIHPPKSIFGILIALTLISALLVGHGMAGRKSRSWTHLIGFVVTMAAAIYLIYELEYPRLGLIRIDAMDQVLMDVRQTMK